MTCSRSDRVASSLWFRGCLPSCRWFLLEQFEHVFCIGRGIWFPDHENIDSVGRPLTHSAHAANVDCLLWMARINRPVHVAKHGPHHGIALIGLACCQSQIEKMTDVRSSVGVQYLLFSRVCQSARKAIEMVVALQQLIGPIERVTERELPTTALCRLSSAAPPHRHLQDSGFVFCLPLVVVPPAGQCLASLKDWVSRVCSDRLARQDRPEPDG